MGVATASAGAKTASGVEAVLQQLETLPTLSPIAARVMALSSSQDAEMDEIIGLMEADPALSAKMLSMCRRAGIAGASSITTVRRAVLHLGLEAVQSAVLSVQIYELFGQAPGAKERREGVAAEMMGATGRFDRAGFWRHSIGVACAAEMIAREHRQLKVRPDEAFIAGLVHDLGKLALDWVLPKSFGAAIELAARRGLSLSAAERQVLGVDHHVVGKRLGERWSLPAILQDAMWLHGQSFAAMDGMANQAQIGVVTLADQICRWLHVGWTGSCDEGADWRLTCEALGLTAAAVERMVPRLHATVGERCKDLGLSEVSGEELAVESLASASAQLSRLHRVSQERAVATRRQGRVLDAIAKFGATGNAGQTVGDLMGDVLRSFLRVSGEANEGVAKAGEFCAVVSQGREGSGWRLGKLDSSGTTVEVLGPFDAPRDAQGLPIDLNGLRASESLGGAVGMLTWLSEHLGGAAMSDAMPDARTLRVLTLSSPSGIGGVIIHQRELGVMCAGKVGLDALTGVWARALSAAGEQDLARKLAETLAQNTRTLHEAQGKLAEAQSMARLGELSAGAAHEMNNPLTVISGKAQLLAQRLTDSRDKADAQVVAQAAAKLTDMATSLHLIANPPMPKREEVKLGELLSTLARQMSGSVATSPGTPGVRVEAGLVREAIMVDRKMFARAMLEVIANGLQAGPSTGVHVRAWIRDDDDRLMIEVTDDGSGMSDHALKHAVDPFFSEKKAGRRSGLGLSVARSIIKAHDGDLRIRSEIGKGTSVTISLGDWRPRGAAGTPSAQAA